MVVANQPDIMVVNKQEKKVVEVDVSIPRDREEGTREAQEIPRAESGARQDVRSKGIIDTSGDRSTRGSNL